MDIEATPNEGAITAATPELEGDIPEETADPAGEIPPEQRPARGVQKRIDELTANWRSTERDRDYWRDMALRTSMPQQPTQPTPETPATPPRPEQFNTYEEYVERLADYKTDQKLAQLQEQMAVHQVVSQFQQKQEAAKSRYADYESTTSNPALPITVPMAQVIHQMDHGPDVAYYLGKHPDEAARIAYMQPIAAAAALGRIEAIFASAKAPEARKPVTNTPAPVPTVGGVSPAMRDPQQMSIDEWMAWRNKTLRKA